MTEADIADLLARVRRLEDHEAVRATWLDYCNRLDAEDWAALGEVFTEDARLEAAGISPAVDGGHTWKVRHHRRVLRQDRHPDRRHPFGAMTGHLSTNMQISLAGDEATTLAYFFEIVDDNLVLVGTYQHRMRRQHDRWRIAFLRITVRYRARLQADKVRGRSLREVLALPV
ncbi:MAG: nuclear transport factor 2 family protein [Acidimicrobiales bacterium]